MDSKTGLEASDDVKTSVSVETAADLEAGIGVEGQNGEGGVGVEVSEKAGETVELEMVEKDPNDPGPPPDGGYGWVLGELIYFRTPIWLGRTVWWRFGDFRTAGWLTAFLATPSRLPLYDSRCHYCTNVLLRSLCSLLD